MLILASSSPRRKELLKNAGIEFTVKTADIPEFPQPHEAPEAFARRLAREKAAAIWKNSPQAFVLAADTIVVTPDEVLGKPADPSDAARMLRQLSGQTHEVLTAVCLKTPAGHEDVRHQVTRVHMGAIDEPEIAFYVAHGEPMDKAGAYAIQGIASRWIDRIEGDFFNVVGLPLALVYRMLRDHGAIQ
ncbi:MAG TPA: Maf family protein [Terriglobales bacterium]|nr:Maf family protein [Terriglobales bacterium]